MGLPGRTPGRPVSTSTGREAIVQERAAIRADKVFGIFWVVFGGTIIAASSAMPIPTHLGATVLTSPGLVPALLGAALVLLGAVLTVRAMRGTTVMSPDEAGVDPDTLSTWRPIVALVMMVVFAAALSLRQPFVPWTTGFVTLFVVAFNWAEKTDTRGRLILVGGALVLGLATALILRFVFEDLFFVRLP